MNDERTRRKPARDELGRVLRTAREGMGLSTTQLGARTGLHRSAILRIETGEIRPTPDSLQALAGVLELDEADLFALAGYRLPERLPALPAYLRAKYHITDEAASQLDEYFQYLASKYNISPRGEANASPPPKTE